MESLTLLQLNQLIANLVVNPRTQNVWITAELSDVAVRGGHCYMELLQKNESTGATVAKARAAIWANQFIRIRSDFFAATGQDFVTGLKVMVKASVSMHPVYGMSLVITAVNPEYTMGDLIRRRNEMLQRLKKEGILEMNRSLTFTAPPLRIAVISAEGAAGYGDFMNQIHNNPQRLRFHVKLFPAIMQGDRVASTVISSLEEIAMQHDKWDCVVIIRGGGATSDLMGFENYELAAHVARFPLPVIVGIGHERDITILDYVACIRVKTPTAAAEWLIAQGKNALDNLMTIGQNILHMVRERLSGCKEQLSRIEGALPDASMGVVERNKSKLDRCALALQQLTAKRIAPQMSRLDMIEASLGMTTHNIIKMKRERLDSIENLLKALSPEATLRRGYSITRFNGHSVKNPNEIPSGAEIITTLAEGTLKSIKE